jgi:hypothetical protein
MTATPHSSARLSFALAFALSAAKITTEATFFLIDIHNLHPTDFIHNPKKPKVAPSFGLGITKDTFLADAGLARVNSFAASRFANTLASLDP